MDHETTVVAITRRQMMRLEMIITDKDKNEALEFLRELRSKIENGSIQGIKSHLDE